MVGTPWGRSETLRSRRLPPGPGSSREAVAENQRERLLGATVASVAARGYAATRLSDLVEISGVSSRSFYALFPDKEACFLATVEALVEMLSEAEDASGFTALLAAQPAAARVCLIEAYAAGPAVRRCLRESIARFETLAAHKLPPGLPAEAASAYVGAILALSRQHLMSGEVERLPAVVAEVEDQLRAAYQPPPEGLRGSARRLPPSTEAIDAPDHAQRILQALTRVVAQDGYASATIDRIVAEAGISASIFYAHFGGKDEAALAAIESGAAQLLAAVLPTFRREGEWTTGVRAALQALFSFLASRPALTRLLFLETFAAGPAGLARREEALRPLEVLFAEGRRRVPEIGLATVDAILGGIFHLVFRRIEESEAPALQNLAPTATYFALAPFVGIEDAIAVANDRGRSRRPTGLDPEAARATAAQPLRTAILSLLAKQELSAAEIVERLDQPEALVRHHLNELQHAALVTAAAGRTGAVRYQTQLGELSTEEWRRLTPSERALITSQILGLSEADLDRARESGTFDARVERVLTRLPQTVDEEGFRELSELFTKTLAGAVEIGARSKARLDAGSEKGFPVLSLMMLFEVPPGELDDKGS